MCRFLYFLFYFQFMRYILPHSLYFCNGAFFIRYSDKLPIRVMNIAGLVHFFVCQLDNFPGMFNTINKGPLT